AREVQPSGARALGGPALRQRVDARARVAPAPGLPRRLGRRAVPVVVSAGAKPSGGPDPEPRVVSGDRAPGRAGGAERVVEPARAGAATAVRCPGGAARPGWAQRGPRPLPRRAGARGGPRATPPADPGPALGAAPCAAAWPARGGAHALAPARPAL